MRRGKWHQKLTREFFDTEYVHNQKTYSQIASELGCSKTTIMYWAERHGVKSRNSGYPRKNLFGKIFGSLQVIKAVPGTRHVEWLCRCECGRTVQLTASSLTKQKRCWDCRNALISQLKWKGTGDISGDYWGSIQRAAAAKNRIFDIFIEDAWEIFLRQDRRCALSGVKLKFVRDCKKEKGQRTASLDRIDSKRGYTKDNVQWVHKDVNRMKQEFTESKFINWCCKVKDHAQHS